MNDPTYHTRDTVPQHEDRTGPHIMAHLPVHPFDRQWCVPVVALPDRGRRKGNAERHGVLWWTGRESAWNERTCGRAGVRTSGR